MSSEPRDSVRATPARLNLSTRHPRRVVSEAGRAPARRSTRVNRRATIPREVWAEGRIFFANVEQLAHQMWFQVEEWKPKIVALDLSAVYDLESTVLKMLVEAEKKIVNVAFAYG